MTTTLPFEKSSRNPCSLSRRRSRQDKKSDTEQAVSSFFIPCPAARTPGVLVCTTSMPRVRPLRSTAVRTLPRAHVHVMHTVCVHSLRTGRYDNNNKAMHQVAHVLATPAEPAFFRLRMFPPTDHAHPFTQYWPASRLPRTPSTL